MVLPECLEHLLSELPVVSGRPVVEGNSGLEGNLLWSHRVCITFPL